MTVIVSVKINDGIVMAADSVSSFPNGISYEHANKIVNLKKGLPIGAMVTGNGGIGNESIETLLKDLRRRFSGLDSAHPDWKLDPDKYTMEDVANRVREFIFTEKAQQYAGEVWMQIRICGYSASRPLSEIWEIKLEGKACNAPSKIQKEEDCGPMWDGEYEALDRLFFGIGTNFVLTAVSQLGMTDEQAKEAHKKLVGGMYQPMVAPAMPFQDAINLARFLVETTIGLVKYSVNRPQKTVGGPIEIAAITKHEGFKWIQRKHFYPAELNVAASSEPTLGQ